MPAPRAASSTVKPFSAKTCCPLILKVIFLVSLAVAALINLSGTYFFTGIGFSGTLIFSPETLTTAEKRFGQTSRHVPHLIHFSWSII